MEKVVSSENVAADYDGFLTSLKRAAEEFEKIPKKESIKVIGHLDADGLCSSAIMINALMRLNRRYSLSILPTITEDSLSSLKDENEKYFVFVDLGSGNLDVLGRVLDTKQIFILDHHMLQSDNIPSNIIHINPHNHHIDGSTEISGAGVVFLFCNYLTSGKNFDMSRIAIVGAIGDVQETTDLRN